MNDASAPEESMSSAFSFTEQVLACDLCGGTRLSIVSPEAKVVACDACGYRFVSPRPSQDEIAGSYSAPDFYDGWIEADAGRLRMWSKRLDMLRRVGSTARVLDIGAGIGTFLALGRDRFGWQVTGTEVSTSAIAFARKRYGIDLVPGRVEEIDIPDSSFDLITLWHVLEHVPSPAQTLEVCHRLLSANGLLAIAVPNDDDARSWLVRTKAGLRRVAPPPRYVAPQPHGEVHLSQFKSSVLVGALRSRGFRVEVVTVDDQYATPTWRSDAIVRGYRVLHRLSQLNFGQASLVLARKSSQ
jgi:SAM-dependent methyltransferase